MNNETGFFHFRVWKDQSGKLIGQQLSIFEYTTWIKLGWHLTSFAGRRATIAILSEDMTITRIHMLEYAIAFMDGNMLEMRFDLAELTTETRPVKPPP